MAKTPDNAQAEPPIAEGTDKQLEAAKQGKPRSFLLVCKGTNVLYLAVSKKPLKQQAYGDAKKQGHIGHGYFGVITGKGMELNFNLSQADGYDAPPVKDKVLKDFLAEHAEFTCKPTIAIQRALPELDFDSDDAKNPLVARFLKLEDQIKQAIAAQPAQEWQLQQQRTAVRNHLLAEEFKEAEPKLNELAQLVADLLDPNYQKASAVPPPPPPTVPPPPAGKPQVDPEMTRFMTRLKDLKPQVEKAVADKWPAANALRSTLGEAAEAARQKQFVTGNKLLDDLDTKLKQAFGEAVNALTGRIKELRPQVEQAIAANTPNVQAVREQFAKATEFAKARELGNANLALDQLAGLLAASRSEEELSPEERTELAAAWASVAEEFPAQRLVLRDWLPLQLKEFEKLVEQATKHAAAGHHREALTVAEGIAPLVEQAQRAKKQADLEVIEEGIVEFRTALLSWNQAVAAATTALKRLQTEMLQRLPTSQDLASRIEVVLEEFNIGLDAVLMEGMMAKDAKAKQESRRKALALVDQFQASSAKNVLVTQLDRCTFTDVNLRGIMENALEDLSEQLAS